MCGEVGSRRGVVVAMRMCVVVCFVRWAFGGVVRWGALSLLLLCDVPLVLLCTALVLLCRCCSLCIHRP